MRILIVEDHSGIRMALQMFLELEGYESSAVDRGEAALELLATQDFALVLLDLTTEGITPFEFMSAFEKLFAGTGRSRPPVGVLSASDRIEERTREIGADFHVRKPFDQAALMLKIAEYANAQLLPASGAGGNVASDLVPQRAISR